MAPRWYRPRPVATPQSPARLTARRHVATFPRRYRLPVAAPALLRAPGRVVTRVVDRSQLAHLPVAILVGAYALRFSLLSVAVHDGYGTPPYDMAIYDQGVWLLSRFHAPFVTTMGRDLFGDHTTFILLAVVPLFWVYPHAQALLVLQACVVAAAAVPVYLVARPRLGTVGATIMAAVLLLNPAVQNGNLEQFHPESFLVLTVALALYAALEGRVRLLLVAVGLSLLVKEDVGLLMAPLGVWVAWKRDRTWGVRITVVSLLWVLFTTQVVIAAILGTASFYANRVPFGGVGGLVRTAVERPAQLWAYARSEGRLFYLWQMAFPVGLAFLRAPSLVAVGTLTLLVNVLSNFGYMHQILYHYSLCLVPVLVIGSVMGLAALDDRRRATVATVAVGMCALWSCVLWGLAPFSRTTYPHLDPHSAQVHDIDNVLAALPPDAVVSAYYPYVSHIDHRLRAYMWPTPFRARYWGLYTQEDQRLPFADQIDWLVLPTDLTGADAATFASVAPSFDVVTRSGDVALYRRR